MSTRFRNTHLLLLAASALTLATAAHAQLRPGASDEQRQRQEQRQEQRQAERSAPAAQAAPRVQAAPQAQAQPQPQARRPGYQANAPQGGSDRPAAAGGGTRQYGTTRDRSERPGFVPRPGYQADRNDRGDWNGHYHRPPRVVHRLPYGYRDYYWNGNRYYYYGGSWYRPYGGSYLSIGVPYGLFVTTLPGAYTSFWYGDSRYFYADRTYYLYEPDRRGYVVTRSPYGDDEQEQEQGELGEELFIYPARGQSEQQQADDRYECHRWAADESDYDPIDDDYDADLREDYLRAMTACLTGRGYTVK